uniref:Uncharacterized protein n=1 Tax=Tanacetum cinerariifolium TaxID=118510 RepID=A0A6L2LHG3_TANCI|nr:hypothetical protein [Tanacetum cinerariifolium]
MMVNQVLVLMKKEIDKELKLEEKFRSLCSKMADIVRNRAKYIEELERYPWLRANVDAVEIARVLKNAQLIDIKKVRDDSEEDEEEKKWEEEQVRKWLGMRQEGMR